MTDENTIKDKSLIWVYPPNKWVSEYNQTFIYGWSKPGLKLYVKVSGKNSTNQKIRKVKVFKNGNFAQVVKLSNKENKIFLVQEYKNKKKILKRSISVKKIKKLLDRSNSISNAVSEKNPRKFLTICIDPGHGGKEHGTHSPKGTPEKTFNLEVAKMLLKTLHATSQQTKIYLTRNKDKFISLDSRVNFAKKKKCDLFLSIHHNALPDNENPLKHRGVGIYYTHSFAEPMAKKLLNSISKAGLKKHGLFKRDFRVTKPNFYTGILIECGFLIHPEESDIITSKQMQRKIVSGIVKALNDQ